MSFLKSALDLADKGFHVFPLHVGGKRPVFNDFTGIATKDHTQINKWWAKVPYNIGIATSVYNGGQALVVVDIDNKNDKHGSDEAFLLEMEGKYFGSTLSQSTPSGGEHLIFKTAKPIKQGTNVLAKGIDIRSRGGYIVGPGSEIDGVAYKILPGSMEILDCPEWIKTACAASSVKEVIEVDTSKIDNERAHKRAMQYLLNEAPHSIEGDGGDETAYKVATRIKDFGVDKEACIDLMADYWNEYCTPSWSMDEIIVKVDNAYRYGLLSPGQDAPEIAFKPVPKEEQSSGEKFYLDRINEEYALIWTDGNHTILRETIDEKGRPARKFMSELTFKRKFSPHVVSTDGDAKPKKWADVWLNWEGRREYEGLCFAPEREARNGYYNMWRGFSCVPKPYAKASAKAKAGFDAFIEHALENVCDNDEVIFTWLMTYFAHLVQKPYDRPLTTIVFKGRKGVGKNVLIDRIGNMLGSGHYLVAHDSRYLTSNFNGHMDACLMLVLDEAFWSGDKAAEGKLKGITTAPEIMIERKGKDPYSVDNLIRLVILGNENWLIPASADERRYSVYDVGDKRRLDSEFFEAMIENIDHKGGNSVLLHHLKTLDLKGADINLPPATEALLDQKLESMDLQTEHWHKCINDGSISALGFDGPWPEKISKAMMRKSFEEFSRHKNSRTRIPSDIAFGRKLKQMCPLIGVSKIKNDENWTNAFKLPDLETCREAFAKWMGHPIKWD